MKRLILAAIVTTLVTACNKTPESAPATGSSATQPTAAAQEVDKPVPVAAVQGDTGIEILAGRGISFEFPNAVNYDIKDVSRNGTPRRRVLLEVLGGTFDEAIVQATKVLTDAGYAKSKDQSAEGKLDQTFAKEGSPTYYLLMQPAAVGPKLNNPDAVGSIHIMWNDL